MYLEYMIKIFLSRFRLDELKVYLENQFLIFENDLDEGNIVDAELQNEFEIFRSRIARRLHTYVMRYGTEVDLETDTESEINKILEEFEEKVNDRDSTRNKRALEPEQV